MKWSEVVITSLNDISVSGMDALKFVENACPSLAIDMTPYDFLIKVNTNSPIASTEDNDVRMFLYSKLKGKAKSLRFLKGKDFERNSLPLARVEWNVVNVNRAKLKVEFIYKNDPRSNKVKEYFKKAEIPVEITFAGNTYSPSSVAHGVTIDGVVDLGTVIPGKYTIKPDYVNLKKCEFDYETLSQDIYLYPGDDKIITFEIERLYQKVQLLAHCLLAIADFTYIFEDNDEDKVNITQETNGKRKIEFKIDTSKTRLYTRGDFNVALPQGATLTSKNDGSGELTLRKKIVYWTREEVEEKYDIFDKINVEAATSPVNYSCKPKNDTLKKEDLGALKTEMYALDFPLNYSEENPRFDLRLLEKKFFWTAGDLDQEEKKNFHFDKIIIGNRLKDSLNIYEVTFTEDNLTFPPSKITNKINVSKDPMENNKGTIAFNARTINWELKDLDDVLDPVMIKVGENPIKRNPDVYKVQFLQRTQPFTTANLEGKWMGKYHGLYTDWNDMNARVNLVRATIDYAYTQAKDDPTILKVFMLPECYFQGRYGAYLVEEADHLLKQLLNLVGDAKWRDWVFVFGTVNLTFGKDIREMMNYSPVVRGGLGPIEEGSGGENDTHLRLIQKLINSEELLDKSQLLHHDKETRFPSVNDAVQFQATQNEEIIGEVLKKLLDKDVNFKTRENPSVKSKYFGLQKKLTLEQWNQLKAELEKNVGEIGLTRVVRYIRNCNIKGKPEDLSQWGLYSGYVDKSKAHLEPETYLGVTSEGLILDFIKKSWEEDPQDKPALTHKDGWMAKTDLRTKILSDINSNLDDLVSPFGITLSYQKQALKSKIEELINDDEAAKQFVKTYAIDQKPVPIPSTFGASIYPIWKKILELFLKDNPSATLLTADPTKMNFRDYCFAARRKAGPWVPFKEVENLEPCKKLIFGLEICADHGSGERIKRALTPEKTDNLNGNAKLAAEAGNAEKAKIKVDIQMVPSAGYYPTDNSVAARKGGYVFNCDGWNKGGEKGVNLIRELFDGPPDEIKHPVTPHTAIAKGGIGVLRDMASFKMERRPLTGVLDPTLGEGILNRSGMGELHVYEEVDLPKDIIDEDVKKPDPTNQSIDSVD